MTDIMLDLETFGSNSYAPIVQIGACYFDRDTGHLGKQFSRNIIPDFKNFTPDANTIEWWMSQSDEARNSLKGNQISLTEALISFNDFVHSKALIWSHSNFDFVILMNAYKILGVKPKVYYKSSRDIRTLTDLAGVSPKVFYRSGVHHNALDDCIFQIQYVTDALRRINAKTA